MGVLIEENRNYENYRNNRNSKRGITDQQEGDASKRVLWKTITKRSKVLQVLLIGLISAMVVTGCGSKKKEESKPTVTIGYLPITHALAVFEEKELLEQENAEYAIKLQKFSSWTDLTDALQAGKIDGASMLIELAMNAVSQGIDLKAVALGHKDGNVIIASNEIQTVEDLKGKTFAIPSNQSSHNILLQDMLATAGMTTSDLTLTQLAPSEMPSSLASGAIDGYCVAEPFGAQAVVQKFGHVLFQSEELWEDSQCCALVLRNAFIQDNQTIADQLINTYMGAGKQLDTETAQKIAKDYLGQDEETLKESLQWIRYDDLELTKEAYDVLVEKTKVYGINEAPPTYEDFVYQPK
ncbi:ABC transporter substrate-binding protein [Anaerosporobacter faecicola]|uniref:ABC transporter substrate-binding protein n=1 Tax=Anaerosporobacter faecicola TaxID=2718714 RepID=UPI001EE5B7B9|nr:ABC transporter substrate-binding protein [Anaerosporobacter faecicola]